MPTYTVELDGQKLDIQGDRPPTEQDVRQALNEFNGGGQDVVPGFENPMQAGQQPQVATESNLKSSIKGANAVALETGRGFVRGSGQMIADVGWVANAGGLFKNGIGDAINQYGRDLMMNAEAMPQTELNGFVKGAAQFVGSSAPMLATFAGGEILGAAKVGELATNAVGTLTNIKAAKYFGLASRSMGQGTLFGVVNAIDTASVLPETMDMKEQVNNILDSGKKGFIMGATLTPLLEIGTKLLSSHGEKAAKSYMVAITGSEQAADSALNLMRKPGTYDAIAEINPNAPIGEHLKFSSVNVNKVSNAKVVEQHDIFNRKLDITTRNLKDEYDIMKDKLSSDIELSKTTLSGVQRGIEEETKQAVKQAKFDKEHILKQNNEKLVTNAVQDYQARANGISQVLQQSQQSFEQTVSSSLDLVNSAKEQAYQSIIQTDPMAGFSAKGLLDKIKQGIQDEYGVTLRKGGRGSLPKELLGGKNINLEASPELQAIMKGKWSAESRAAGGEVNANATKVVKYLTETLLPDLEEKISTNNGIYTLDMLRETTKNIKAKGYEDGISNPGFAWLDRIFRANKNVGDLTKVGDKGLFIGSDVSYEAIKKAALLDERFYNIKSAAEDYTKTIGNSVESKAKVFGKDIEAAKLLSKLEAHMELPVESPLRLTNAMKSYYEESKKLLTEHEAIKSQLSELLDRQKLALSKEIDRTAFIEKEAKITRQNQERIKWAEERKLILQNKEIELRRVDEIHNLYKKAIDKEKFDRAAAQNEIRLMGRTDVPLGNIQRSMLRASGLSFLFFKPTFLPLLAASTLLSPKVAVGLSRGLVKLSKSKSAKVLMTAGQSKLIQRLLIGNAMKR